MNDPGPPGNGGDMRYVQRELGAHLEHVPIEFGARLRAARLAENLGLRELSRRIGVSASMVSQLERGTVMPSIATLYRLVSELGLSLDELFRSGDQDTPSEGEVARGPQRIPGARVHKRGVASSPVQRKDSRPTATLDTGVMWQRLTPA